MIFTRPSETRVVRIYDNCEVDNGVVNVSRDAGDTVRWISVSKSEFSIDFDSSPFEKKHFDVSVQEEQPQPCADSGPLKDADHAPYATYHYKIQNKTNPEYKSDPGVDVRK
jgi:hypothetical protein